MGVSLPDEGDQRSRPAGWTASIRLRSATFDRSCPAIASGPAMVWMHLALILPVDERWTTPVRPGQRRWPTSSDLVPLGCPLRSVLQRWNASLHPWLVPP